MHYKCQVRRMEGVKTVVANRCKQSTDIWKDGPQQQTAK